MLGNLILGLSYLITTVQIHFIKDEQKYKIFDKLPFAERQILTFILTARDIECNTVDFRPISIFQIIGFLHTLEFVASLILNLYWVNETHLE